MATIDISGQNDSDVINGAIITNTTLAISTGTGVFDPFLAIQHSPEEQGFNTDSSNLPFDDTHDEFTHSILLDTVPVRIVGGVEYLEFRVDLNETNSKNTDLILLEQLKIFQESSPDMVQSDWNGTGFHTGDAPEYTLGDNTVLLSAAFDAGSGKGDYVFLVPKANFDFSGANPYLYVYMQMGTPDNKDPAQSDGGFDEFGVLKVVNETPPSITIDKTGPATVNEGGADVTWHFVITNTSGLTDPVTVTSLTDDKLGDLLAAAQIANNGMPIVLASGASFTFDYNPAGTNDVDLNAGATYTNVVTVMGHDDENTPVSDTDDHTITAKDVAPVIEIVKSGPATIDEGGANVIYNFTITNHSVETDPVTVTSLTDDKLGDLLAAAEAANGGNHIVLASGGSFTFNYDPPGDLVLNAGATLTNVVTVMGHDDENTPVSDTDDHTITAKDVAPVIEIVKSGPATIDEGGANVIYNFTITNHSVETDPVTVTSLTDDKLGDLLAAAEAANGGNHIVLASGGSFTFNYDPPGDLVLNAGATLTNVVTVMGHDDENTPVSDTDDHTITAKDVAPVIEIVKSGPATIDEGGANVIYNFTITNHSVETDPVTVTSLTDDKLGDLLAAAEAANGGNHIVLASGGSFTFNYDPPGDLVLNAGATLTNVVTVMGHDDENTPVSDTDDHTITAKDVAPVIEIVKSGPATIDEGGANVIYNFTITNHSVETDPVTVTSLTDDKLGDLLAAAEAANGGNHIVLASGGSFTFNYDPPGDLVLNAGATLTNVVTVMGHDDENTPVSDTDDHTITAKDVAPVIEIVKSGPATIDEGGANVIYNFTITNHSVETDPVTVTSLTDDKLGDLLAAAEAANGGNHIVLASGGSFTFNYDPPGDLVLNAGATLTNVVTVMGHDDENTPVSDTDDHTITATNVPGAVSIVKTVDGDGDGQFHDSEMVQAFGDSVTYKYAVTNASLHPDVDPLTLNDLVDDMGQFADVTLMHNGVLAAGVSLDKSGGDQDALLEKGETWTFQLTTNVNLAPGETEHNVATVTGHDDDGSSVTAWDDANITAVTGPGVRTPGFWGNLGLQFWDGIQHNETKSGPTFPTGELTYAVDGDNNSSTAKVAGLLLGDYNKDGVTGPNEDTFFISLADAHKIIDSSQTPNQDGRYVLGRDAVATWLNFLAGNPIGDANTDSHSPQHFLDEGIDWLQATNGGTAADTFGDWGDGTAVKQGSATGGWNNPLPGVPDNGSVIHTELDTYNNTGSTFEVVGGVNVFHMYATADH